MKPILKDGIWNFEKCPLWLKKKYREAVKYICQECNRHEDKVGKLTPHRVKRGNVGGFYTVCKLSDKRNNIKVVCNECHKKLHENEFKHISNSY